VAKEQAAGQSVRLELDRVLASELFVRSERISRFLRYIVERSLQDHANQIKETVIAVDVYERAANYDPKTDPVVRNEARRLRAKLREYYEIEGCSDPIRIDVPKGSYTPVFQYANDERKTRSTPSWLAVALAGLVVVMAAMAWWWGQHKSAPIPIAVLPLTNLSKYPGNDYFADGLTDEIIRNLSIIDGLAVRSQTSSFVFKASPRNIRETGKQLAVDYILEGSVVRAGQQLRINAQLVRVRDDSPLWSGRFDRKLTDVLLIQDEISRGIVNSLRLKLGRGRRRYETSTEAYDLYLRARSLPIQRGLSGYDQSIVPLEEAIAKDPSFAPAYAGLAAAHAARSGEFRFDLTDETSKMRAAAEKTIQLDPLLAEAHDALGMAYGREGQWEQSGKSFRRAIELDPGRSMSYVHFALFLLLPLGRIEEALNQLRVAEKTDPLSPEVHSQLAWVLISAGRYDEAAGHCEHLLPDHLNKSTCLARARLGQGRIAEAIQILASGVTLNNRAYLGYAYGRAGQREEAEKLATAVSANDPFFQALIFAGLGDKDRTLEALDRMVPLGPFRMGRTLTYPEFALLRGDPRVKALRKMVGLPK
jgi:serine/threonine-protein kinase